jgi:hypothetical protein
MKTTKFPENFEIFLETVSSVAQIYKGENFALMEYAKRYDLKAANKKPNENAKRPTKNNAIHPLDDLFVGVQWETGGVRGGSWHQDAKPERFISNEQPVSITPLICKVLIAVGRENLSFVQYSAYIETLFRKGSSTNSEDCYGNSVDYNYVAVNLKELYDALVDF